MSIMNIISEMGCRFIDVNLMGWIAREYFRNAWGAASLFRLPAFCHMDGCKWRLMGGAVIVMYPLRWFLCFQYVDCIFKMIEASLNKMRCIEALCSPFSVSSAQTHIVFRKRSIVCRDYSISAEQIFTLGPCFKWKQQRLLKMRCGEKSEIIIWSVYARAF